MAAAPVRLHPEPVHQFMGIVALALVLATGGALWRHHRRTMPEHRARRVVAALLVVAVFVPVGVIYGRWAYMTVRCGHQPVAISDLAAAYSYQLPGDRNYRRDSLFQDFVCSEADAERKGYGHVGGE